MHTRQSIQTLVAAMMPFYHQRFPDTVDQTQDIENFL
jgi:hypothetical protein